MFLNKPQTPQNLQCPVPPSINQINHKNNNPPPKLTNIIILSLDEKEEKITFKYFDEISTLPIKDFLSLISKEKLKQDKKNSYCIMHPKNENINYCLECNMHLCNDCLATRIHRNHNKLFLSEFSPKNDEINLILKKISILEQLISNCEPEKNVLKQWIIKKYENNKKDIIEENKIKEKFSVSEFQNEIEKNKTNFQNEENIINEKYRVLYEKKNKIHELEIQAIKEKNYYDHIFEKIKREKENLFKEKEKNITKTLEDTKNLLEIYNIIFDSSEKYNNNHFAIQNLLNIINKNNSNNNSNNSNNSINNNINNSNMNNQNNNSNNVDNNISNINNINNNNINNIIKNEYNNINVVGTIINNNIVRNSSSENKIINSEYKKLFDVEKFNNIIRIPKNTVKGVLIKVNGIFCVTNKKDTKDANNNTINNDFCQKKRTRRNIQNNNFLKNYTIYSVDKISIENNFICDLNLLTNFCSTKLKQLLLKNNSINNIDLLYRAKIPNLEEIDFSGNQITTISVFSKIKFLKLKILNLSNNFIKNINILGKVHFPNIESLDFSDNKIKDINVLKEINFPKLKIFDLHKNEIDDISVLKDMKFGELEVLDLKENNYSIDENCDNLMDEFGKRRNEINLEFV